VRPARLALPSGDERILGAAERYNQMLLEQLHSTVRWESEPAIGWRIADLDTSEIVRTLEEAIRRGRAEDPGTRDSLEILRGLGLVRGDHLLRAAAP
jgi:ATP-dependent DNA helicase RecG